MERGGGLHTKEGQIQKFWKWGSQPTIPEKWWWWWGGGGGAVRQKRVSDIIIMNVCSKLKDIFSFFFKTYKMFPDY